MRAAVLLLIIAVLLIAAGWNANAVIDAYIDLLANDATRATFKVGCGLTGALVLVVVLVVLSRRAYRQIDRDFPDNWKR